MSRKIPFFYVYIASKLTCGDKKICQKEFVRKMASIRIREEMWFEMMRDMTEMGLIRGYESCDHSIMLKKELSKSEKKRLSQVFMR